MCDLQSYVRSHSGDAAWVYNFLADFERNVLALPEQGTWGAVVPVANSEFPEASECGIEFRLNLEGGLEKSAYLQLSNKIPLLLVGGTQR